MLVDHSVHGCIQERFVLWGHCVISARVDCIAYQNASVYTCHHQYIHIYRIQSDAATCVVFQIGVGKQIIILHMHLIFIKHVIGSGLWLILMLQFVRFYQEVITISLSTWTSTSLFIGTSSTPNKPGLEWKRILIDCGINIAIFFVPTIIPQENSYQNLRINSDSAWTMTFRISKARKQQQQKLIQSTVQQAVGHS